MARIGVDIDGVLADFNFRFAEIIRGLTGVPVPLVTPDYPDQWNYHTAAGVTEAQEPMLYRAMSLYGEWGKLRAYEGAMGFFAWYRRNLMQHDIYFITSRHPEPGVKIQTEEWLGRHLATNTRIPTVLLSKDKGRLAKALQLDYMIEDKPENLLSMPAGVVRILVNQPWNRRHDKLLEFDGVHRVPDAAGAASLIDAMERARVDR